MPVQNWIASYFLALTLSSCVKQHQATARAAGGAHAVQRGTWDISGSCSLFPSLSGLRSMSLGLGSPPKENAPSEGADSLP